MSGDGTLPERLAREPDRPALTAAACCCVPVCAQASGRDGPSASASKSSAGRPGSDLPVQDRLKLEKDMRKAAQVAGPLLSQPAFKSILDWSVGGGGRAEGREGLCRPGVSASCWPCWPQEPSFYPDGRRTLLHVHTRTHILALTPGHLYARRFNEWGSRQKLEEELGTDVHEDEGTHRLLLLDAIEGGQPQACYDVLHDILQVWIHLVAGGVDSCGGGWGWCVCWLVQASC